MSFCSYTYVNRIMHCVNPIRCPTRCYLMLTLENYLANGCKRKRWRSVKLSKRYLRAPDDRKKNVTLWTKFFGESRSCKLATSFWNSLSKSRLIYLSILYLLTYQFATSIDGNFLQPTTYHTASCSNKRVFFLLLFSLLEILHLGREASVVNSLKKTCEITKSWS